MESMALFHSGLTACTRVTPGGGAAAPLKPEGSNVTDTKACGGTSTGTDGNRTSEMDENIRLPQAPWERPVLARLASPSGCRGCLQPLPSLGSHWGSLAYLAFSTGHVGP